MIATNRVSNIVFSDVDHADAPDYCDAFIESADYDGVPMTVEQLDELNEDSDFKYEALQRWLY